MIRDGDRMRGVHASPRVVAKNIILEKNAPPSRHKPRGYTQICVGILPYMENRRESPIQFRQNYKIVKYFECENNILLPCTCLSSAL